jgi:hypothetical protein
VAREPVRAAQLAIQPGVSVDGRRVGV